MSKRQAFLNPIDLEICWSRLIAVVDEAAAALVRTSFSTVVRESNDFACVLLDEDGRALAQSTLSVPGFIGTAPLSLRRFLEVYPKESLRPGDILLTNDPWIGTGHLPDSTMAAPIFAGRRLIGFIVTVAHLSDVGGRQWSADATEMFEEGIRIPVSKFYDTGVPNQMLLKVIEANVRTPQQVLGDLGAQVVAIETATRGVQTLLREYGFPDLRLLGRSILTVSANALRDEIRKIPKGEYVAEIEADGWDAPVRIRATVSVYEKQISVDYTGSSPQNRYGINEVYNHTFAYTVYPLKCMLIPSMPNNDGFTRLFQVIAPEGLIVNSRPPAAVGARQLVGHLLQGAIFEALAPVLPERVQADSGTPLWTLVFRGLDTERGRAFSTILFFNGGTGAMTSRDGFSVTSFPANISTTPVEVIENLAPLLVRIKRIAADSGGPGRQRGGCGQVVAIESRWPGLLRVSLLTERTKVPPRGLLGGMAGRAGFIHKNGVPVAETKGIVELREGDILEFCVPGGGGVGQPSERDPQLVARDIRDGFVTREAAKVSYDVSG
jgi:N-methylhydantoinase B